MRTLFEHKSDISSCFWGNNNALNRSDYFDFPFNIVDGRYVLAYGKYDQVGSDWQLLEKPLRPVVWLSVFSLFLLIAVVRYFCNQYYKSSELTSLSAWAAFTILHASFSGSLTVDFTVKENIPFKTVEQGLALYPSRDLIVWDSTLQIIFPSEELMRGEGPIQTWWRD